MNKIKGDKYEIQIRDYIINELNSEAYLWHHTPENDLLKYGIIGSHNEHRLKRIDNKVNSLIDTGIDIIQIDDNKCSLVQCKNGYKSGVTINDLAGFNAWMGVMEKLDGYIYYTNKLSTNVKCLPYNKRFNYIKQVYNLPVEVEIKKEIIVPYEHQIITKDKIIKYFENNNRCILSKPCGTGKTLMSFLVSKNYKQIIILSPLKEFAKQNLTKFIEYGYVNNTLLVDSDGERDVKEIIKFINENESFVISSTFCSIDVIFQCLEHMKDPLFIIDEFHNLSKNNVIDENDDFYKLLNSEHRILFVSATPRVYELEDDDYNIDDIFGTLIDTMTFTEAINKKYITDYRIFLPSIHEDNDQLNTDLTIYEIDSVIKAKCNYFFSCLLNIGSQKCIIYCIDTKELKMIIDGMKKLNDFYCLSYDASKITSKTSAIERRKILDDFASNSNIQLLFSVRILDECIDIPTCDSIFISYPSQSKTRTIQRMSRCIRIDKNNKFKIGNVFIWCSEYDEIINILSGIKEYDIYFKDKVVINSTNYFGNSLREKLDSDVKLVEKYIVGVKEFKQLTWVERLNSVIEYIDNNDKLPSNSSKNNEIKILGKWLSHQKENYKNKKQIMSDENIYNQFTKFLKKYEEYFTSNEDNWKNKLDELEEYIIKEHQLPSTRSKNNEIKILGSWLFNQKNNYKDKKYIMGDENIYNQFTRFLEEYEKYFTSNEDNWKNKLGELEIYIIKEHQLPSIIDKDNEIKILGSWLLNQKNNYKDKKYIMGDENIYNQFTRFLEEYEKYFTSNEDNWKNKLTELEAYIIKENKLPTQRSKNNEVKILEKWLSHQKQNYKNKKQIMKDENIYNQFTKFIEEYEKYFTSNEDNWKDKLIQLKNYIIKEHKLPSEHDKNKEIKILGKWSSTQKQNYKNKKYIMCDENIYNQFTKFLEEYKKYFTSNKIIKKII
jgi:superfamily II DNA or RNA helicase